MQTASPLSVIYFVCHDLGRALGCYGAGVPTPNLDRSAAESIVFTKTDCASPVARPASPPPPAPRLSPQPPGPPGWGPHWVS